MALRLTQPRGDRCERLLAGHKILPHLRGLQLCERELILHHIAYGHNARKAFVLGHRYVAEAPHGHLLHEPIDAVML